LSSVPSPCLPCWLIEPCFDIVLPMLFKVPIRHNIIMLLHRRVAEVSASLR